MYYEFTGWNTAADGSGTLYADEADITITENTTLYAQWLLVVNTHSWGYSASGDTITASCSGTGAACDIDTGLTMTISAPASLTYNGTAKAAALNTDYDTTAFPGTYTITYRQGTTALTGAPVNAGDYTASVTVGTVTASVDFTITKADPTYTKPTGLTATYGDKLSSVTLPAGWTWADGTQSVGNAGDHTFKATYTPTDTGNYNTVSNIELTVTVGKADPTVTAPTAKTGLVYSGSAQALVNAGSTDGGTYQYSLDGTAYSTAIPTGTDQGTYTVYYRVTGNKNYKDVAAASVQVQIAKAASGAAAPTANTLTYNGSAQALVTAGTPTGGTMQYALGSEIAATGTFGTDIPTGTDAGTYYVWYKVVGDSNHNDTDPAKVMVSIAKAKPEAPAVTAQNESVSGKKDGKILGLTTAMEVSAAGADYAKVTDPDALFAAGTYNVRLSETGNYLASDATEVTITAGDKLTVTFDADGGSSVAAQSLDWGETATEPTAPTKAGYSFKEWQLDGKAYDFTAAVTADITLKAVWTINQYTITFSTGGGTAIAPITQDYGTAITKPADPTWAGYTFLGWNPEIPAAMPAGDLTVTAQWRNNTPVYVPTGVIPAPVDNSYKTEITPVTLTSDERALIEKEFGGNESIGQAYEVKCYQGGRQVTGTTEPVLVELPVPDELINTDPTVTRTFFILRIHGNTVTRLDTEYDAAKQTAKAYSDEFSIYVLAFADEYEDSSDIEAETETDETDDIEDTDDVSVVSDDDDTEEITVTEKPDDVSVISNTEEDSNPHTEAPLAGMGVFAALSFFAAAAAYTAKKRK